MPTYANSPEVNFTHAVGTSAVKNTVKTLILDTINAVAPEVNFNHRTLNIQLTRANTGATAGHLKISFINGHIQKPTMSMMVNMKRVDSEQTIIHETIHWLQFQLNVATAVRHEGRYVYLWDNATGALLNARGQGDNALLNMMTEGRTWNATAPTLGTAQGVRVHRHSTDMKSTHGRLNYYLDPAESQAHRLALPIAKRLGQPQAVLDSCLSMAGKQMNAVKEAKEGRRTTELMGELWTVVNR